MDKKHYTIEELICDESFLAFCEGSDTDAVAYWTNWLAEHPEQADIVQQAKDLLDGFSVILPEEEFLQEKERLHQALGQNKSKRTKVVQLWVRWAAVASLVLCLGIFIWYRLQIFEALKVPSVAEVQIDKAWNEVTADYGKLIRVGFPDGSHVVLAGGSTLRYPKEFRKDSVIVELSGNAHFDIFHNPDRVFTVHTKLADIAVLGTNFLVEERSKQRYQVSLFNGKIGLTMPGKQNKVILAPGQKAIIDDDGQTDVSIFSKQHTSNFEKGILSFDDADFEEVAMKFKRYYDITLTNRSRNGNWRVTGQYENMTMQEILQTICFIKGLKYKKTANNQYVLY